MELFCCLYKWLWADVSLLGSGSGSISRLRCMLRIQRFDVAKVLFFHCPKTGNRASLSCWWECRTKIWIVSFNEIFHMSGSMFISDVFFFFPYCREIGQSDNLFSNVGNFLTTHRKLLLSFFSGLLSPNLSNSSPKRFCFSVRIS